MLYRLCNVCHKKVSYGTRCECEIKAAQERVKKYDKENRNKEGIKFYKSKDWKIVNKTIRSRQHNVCINCLLNNYSVVAADVVHHIVELVMDSNRALDTSNLICLCHSCHNEVHTNYNKGSSSKCVEQERLFALLEVFNNNYN